MSRALGTATRDFLSASLQRARDRGFLGPGPVERHIDHALGFVVAIDDCLGVSAPVRLVDLGAGGGLPGLVLASCYPTTAIALVDGSDTRSTFLRAEVQALQEFDPRLFPEGRPVVVGRRAEDLGRDAVWREQVDVVVARSFGAPAVLAECASPLLTLGGILVSSEPPTREGLDRWPVGPLELVGLRPDRRSESTAGTFQVCMKDAAIDGRYPRRVGVPSKRPLF